MSITALIVGEALIDEVVEGDRVSIVARSGADLPTLGDIQASRIGI